MNSLVFRLLLIGAFLLGALLHARTLYQRVYAGYPYEQWDEMSSSNNANVLDEPETFRVYSYGSLDTLVHAAAHFYYQKFDSVGKRIERHSYANNVLESIEDPYVIFGPKTWDGLDYSYFRGLADRKPIFLARAFYFGLAYLLAALLIGVIFWCYSGCAFAIGAALALFFLSQLFVEQSALALPNAMNALLALGICLLIERSIILQRSNLLFLACALLAAAMNFKLDAMLLGLPLGLAFAWHLASGFWARGAFSQYLIDSAKLIANALGVFIAALCLTRPALLWRPEKEFLVQWKTLTHVVDVKKDLYNNFAALNNYLLACLEPLQKLASVGSISIILLLGGAVFLIASRTQSHQTNLLRQIAVILVLLIGCVWLFWVPTYSAAQVVYVRYYLTGSAVAALLFGLTAYYLLSSRQRILHIFAALGISVVLVLAFELAQALYRETAAIAYAREISGGVDPAHNRSVALVWLANEIEKGKFSRRVLIDQHGYFDLRVLLQHNISTQYVNVFNHRKVFGRFRAAHKREAVPIAVVYSDGDIGWTGKPAEEFQVYYKALHGLPIVHEIEGPIMSTLSPAPPESKVNVKIAVLRKAQNEERDK